MAVTVSAKNFTSINYCENAANFTGSTPADVTDFYQQGTQCVGFTMKSSGNNDTYLTGTWNLSNKHIHFWYMTTALKELNVEASGGFQIYLSDGTNTGYYYLTGSDTYPGGWYNLVLDCNRSPSSGSQPTLTAITTIGFRQNLTTNAKNVQNTWIDNIYVADGLIAYGDLTGSPFDLDDIISVEINPTNGGWGILRKISGVYFLTGALDFGDTVSTNLCDFAESGQVIVFEDRPVATTYYGMTVAGNTTGTTEFTMGSKSGSLGVGGCVIRVESLSQTPKFFVDVDDTNLDVLQFYGCSFVDHNAVSLPTRDTGTPTNREVLSCTFESGNSAVVASTCTVKYCNFISSAGVSLQIDATTNYVSDCFFIACQTGVKVTVEGTYGFVNMVFTGCTYDLENSNNATTTASYSESNYDSDQQLYSGATTGTAQSFDGDGGLLTSVSLYLRKVNSPTGNAYAKLYATSGGVPTGSALATSKALDVTTLTASYAVTKIEFDDSEFYTIASGTNNYAISLEYSGGDATNRVEVGYDAGGSHGGTKSDYTASWAADTGNDLCFYVRTEGEVTIGASGTTSLSVFNNSGTPAGVTNLNNAVTVKVTVKNTSLVVVSGARVYLKAASGGPLTVGTVILNDLSDGSGIVQDTSFNYTSAQPVVGWVRKSTTSPLYKQFDLAGTIGSGGFDTTAIMASDE